MNKQKFTMFGIFALVLASGASMASSTFAWFTTNRSASITFGSASIENRDPDLQVSFLGSQNGLTNTGSGNAIVLNGVNRVTDISGDGINFYKPSWSATKTEGGTGEHYIPSTITTITDADGYYVDIFVKVAAISDNANPRGVKVYLGANTRISPVNPLNARDVDAVNSVRMAVIEYDDATRTNPSVKHLHAPTLETNPHYLVKDASASAYEYPGFALQEATTLNSQSFKTESLQSNATYEIADFMATEKEAFIGFRFWIEGTDTEAVREKALGGMFKVNLDIYSLSE